MKLLSIWKLRDKFYILQLNSCLRFDKRTLIYKYYNIPEFIKLLQNILSI